MYKLSSIFSALFLICTNVSAFWSESQERQTAVQLLFINDNPHAKISGIMLVNAGAAKSVIRVLVADEEIKQSLVNFKPYRDKLVCRESVMFGVSTLAQANTIYELIDLINNLEPIELNQMILDIKKAIHSKLLYYLSDPNKNQRRAINDHYRLKFNCTICFEDKIVSSRTKLLCGHQFCNDCLMEHFLVALQDQTKPTYQLCPDRECLSEIEEADVRAFSKNNKDTLQKFHDMKLRRCVKENPNLRLCPGNDCMFLYELNANGQPEQIRCPQPNCSTVFCSHCQGNHNPRAINCQDAANIARLSESQLEQESVRWAEQNSKQCPSCRTHIQKNGGCQYVKCGSCQELFCWECNESFGKQLTGHSGSIPNHEWH